jgi:hypothetical protein
MLPVALDAVTMQAIERDPAKRFGNAAIFADELERAARSIHAVADPRDVARYVEAVIGTEIAQRRDMIRALLARGETSSPGIDTPARLASIPGRGSSSVSSAALSLPVEPGSGSEMFGDRSAAGRSKRHPVLLGTIAIGILLAGGFVAWSALNIEPSPAAIPVSASVPTVTLTAPPPPPPPPSASAAPIPPVRATASAPSVQPAPRPVPAPRPNVVPVQRRPRPAATAAPPSRPPPPDDIPSNPYRQ